MPKRVLFAFVLLSFAVQACASDSTRNLQEVEEDMEIILTSSAFEEGEMIPVKYSCDGDDISPPLSWSNIPEGTESLALIVDDPDAPAGTWVHWVLYNIPADHDSLPEGLKGVGIEGKNTSGNIGYGGPCPPRGPAHRYFFKIYALETRLDLDAGATKDNLEMAMEGHSLAQGQLMGRYQR